MLGPLLYALVLIAGGLVLLRVRWLRRREALAARLVRATWRTRASGYLVHVEVLPWTLIVVWTEAHSHQEAARLRGPDTPATWSALADKVNGLRAPCAPPTPAVATSPMTRAARPSGARALV